MSDRRNVVASNGNEYYSNAFLNPVVPDGYRHISETTWSNGFMIERITDGSIFTFVPVGFLKDNGTLDGKKFNQKFGRRRWYPTQEDELGHESVYGMANPLWNQLQSIREYGGFYISSCPISRTKDMKQISNPDNSPLTMVDFDRAMQLAISFERSKDVTSHLLFGSEYDSMLEWIIETEAMTIEEVTDSIEERKDSCINNIYGLGGVAEWTQEKAIYGSKSRPAVRGATHRSKGARNPIAWRQENYKYIKRPFIGYRVALYIY